MRDSRTPSLDSIAEFVIFLSQLLGVPAEEITTEKRLFHDFEIDGDDLFEILLPLRDDQGLNIDDFDPRPYFGSEFDAGWGHTFHSLTGFRHCRLLPFTVGDLFQAMQQGKLKGRTARSSKHGAE
jgi:hypothetical protein